VVVILESSSHLLYWLPHRRHDGYKDTLNAFGSDVFRGLSKLNEGVCGDLRGRSSRGLLS
jgi:hypothetical protein